MFIKNDEAWMYANNRGIVALINKTYHADNNKTEWEVRDYSSFALVTSFKLLRDAKSWVKANY